MGVVWLLAVVAMAVRLQVVASRMDWNGLMQKLCACFGWIMIFAAVLAVLRPSPRANAGRTLALIVMACVGALTRIARGAPWGGPRTAHPCWTR